VFAGYRSLLMILPSIALAFEVEDVAIEYEKQLIVEMSPPYLSKTHYLEPELARAADVRLAHLMRSQSS
jgi:hypothetical protein